MIGIIDFKAARPTPSVLRQVVVNLAEDLGAGRYGDCSLIYCSQDEDTRSVIEDIAESQNVVLFLCSSPKDLRHAEPVGDITITDLDTLNLVLQAGGTVSASRLAAEVGIERNAAGNRLVSLQKRATFFARSGHILREIYLLIRGRLSGIVQKRALDRGSGIYLRTARLMMLLRRHDVAISRKWGTRRMYLKSSIVTIDKRTGKYRELINSRHQTDLSV